MTKHLFISFLLITCLSCGIHHDKQNDCTYKVKMALKDVSKYITVNKETKVYTLHYAKLPEIEKSRFEKLRDSIEYASYIPHDENMVKHYLYSKELKNLSKIFCEISVADIRKYFGRESASGTNNGIIHSMFYWFNGINYDNCNPT
ncbi:MAG: hypothetical protein LC107_09315 [Chitinophagales bacterium]|nr:hypothetical protein [Chitinophagales bacterium]